MRTGEFVRKPSTQYSIRPNTRLPTVLSGDASARGGGGAHREGLHGGGLLAVRAPCGAPADRGKVGKHDSC